MSHDPEHRKQAVRDDRDHVRRNQKQPEKALTGQQWHIRKLGRGAPANFLGVLTVVDLGVTRLLKIRIK